VNEVNYPEVSSCMSCIMLVVYTHVPFYSLVVMWWWWCD